MAFHFYEKGEGYMLCLIYFSDLIYDILSTTAALDKAIIIPGSDEICSV